MIGDRAGVSMVPPRERPFRLRAGTGKVTAVKRLVTVWMLVLVLPAAAWAGDVERGEAEYALCSSCHLDEGEGNEQLAAPALAGLSEDYLKRQLGNYASGVRGSAEGDILGAQMMTLAKTLEGEAVADLSAFIATLEARMPKPSVEGDTERGAQLYTLCATCHGADGKGVEAMAGNNLIVLQDWYLVRQLEGFKAGYRGKNKDDVRGMQMAGMVATLPDAAAIRDVVAYIASLREDP